MKESFAPEGRPGRPLYARGPMSFVEAALGVLVVGALTYFAYTAVGDDFPLNVVVAALALVVVGWLVVRAAGTRGRG